MPHLTPPSLRLLQLVALSAGFAVAHTQSPLFFSNQNQYLLHGLADAGYGHLEHDWLANTSDPAPLFSAGVAAAYRLAGLWPLHVAYFVLLMGYFLAAWWLVAALPDFEPSGRVLLGFAALFTAAHAAILRVGSVVLTGVDYPWYFQSGVAGQYVLGPGIQPSAFGVLLVGSLSALANGRPHLAAALAGGAALFHATYLLPAALLTLGYMIQLIVKGGGKVAVRVGGVALAIVVPALAYTLVVFPPAVKFFADSQRILAEIRIPHHASVVRWFDVVAALQVVWIAAGIVAVRKTVLFVPLLTAAGGAVALTLAQLATGDHTLALLFPWRVSAVLVPVATAVLAAKLVAVLPVGRVMTRVSGLLLMGLVVCGVLVMVLRLGYRMNEAERPVLEYAREHAGPNDVYLIPTRFPAVGTGRGSVSTSFTPAPRPKPGSNLIPVDLQRFRLATGAPIFADFKSVPYGSSEVQEWYRRVRLAEAWYAEPDWDQTGVRDQLIKERITHVLIPRHQDIRANFLKQKYADEAYAVYRVE